MYFIESESDNNNGGELMRKAIGIVLGLAMLVGTSSTALAANPSVGHERGKSIELKMTEEQKSQIIAYKIQILELKKQIIKENVKNGTITPQQAEKMEERINARLEALKSGQLGGGFHRSHAPGLANTKC